MLGLHDIVLAPGSLGLVVGALSSQPPLPLELPALLFQLAHRLERDRNAIRGESIKEEALDHSIDRQGPDFLT